jgi:excinuclease ABC subunit A
MKSIQIRGLKTHNLKSINLDLPLGRFIVVTGVGGAGKTSLAIDTLFVEGRRRYVETFSARSRMYLDRLEKPDVERIDGLPAAIAAPRGRSRRSTAATVGSIGEIRALLVSLFVRKGKVICTECGTEVGPRDAASIAHRIDQLDEGVRYQIAFPLEIVAGSSFAEIAASLVSQGFARARIDGAIVELDSSRSVNITTPSIDVVVDRLVRGRDSAVRRLESIEQAMRSGSGRIKILFDDQADWVFESGWRCGGCGTEFREPSAELFTGDSANRLSNQALAVRIDGQNFADASSRSIEEIQKWLQFYQSDPRTHWIVKSILDRLGDLVDLGLGYLSLDRELDSLARGEERRVAFAATLNPGLVGVLYVFDEPAAGLYPTDVDRLIAQLLRARDRGDTVVVVEHDRSLIGSADYLVDLGPGGGDQGGEVVYAGPPEGIENARRSITRRFLAGRSEPLRERPRRKPNGYVEIKNACAKNLKDVCIKIPLGVLCAVIGPSGSGKSALVQETLRPWALETAISGRSISASPAGDLSSISSDSKSTAKLRSKREIDSAVWIDRSNPGVSERSITASVVGAFGEIRTVFAETQEAKVRGYSAINFSFRSREGRCRACEGRGAAIFDRRLLADLKTQCETCQGTRYRAEILEVRYQDRSIAEVLEMTVQESLVFFRNRPRLQALLRPLRDVGLDYLRLGDVIADRSAGESLRLKLAIQFAKSRATLRRPAKSSTSLFMMDEPSAGLHPSEIEKMLEVFDTLLAPGGSIVVVDSNPHIWASADFLIELGPGAGPSGGSIVAYGTPEEIAAGTTSAGGILAAMKLVDRKAQ